MSQTLNSMEARVEDALLELLKGSLGDGIGLLKFEDLAGDAEPPLVVVKAERQGELTADSGVWEVLTTVTGRDVHDRDWARVERRLLNRDAIRAALVKEGMAPVRGQFVDFDEPSEREVDEEYQRTFAFRLFGCLCLC